MNVLLCGIGKMGSAHLRVLQEMALGGSKDLGLNLKLAGITDTNAQRLEELAKTHRLPTFPTLEEALTREKFDAVFITAPTRVHFELAEQVLTQKIPLFLEKPIAFTAQEGEKLCKLALRNQIPLMIGHVERFNPAIARAHALIREGALGEILHISTKRVGGSPQNIPNAGDVLVDLGVHDIDVIQWLIGDSAELKACVGHTSALQSTPTTTIDSATLLLTCRTSTADVHVNWVTPIKIREIQITGSLAFLQLNLITQKVVLTHKNPVLVSDITGLDFQKYLKSFSTPEQLEIPVEQKEPLFEEIRAFLEAITKGIPVPITGLDGLRALRIAEQARNQMEQTPLMVIGKSAYSKKVIIPF